MKKRIPSKNDKKVAGIKGKDENNILN